MRSLFGWLDPFVALLLATLVVAALAPPVGTYATALGEVRWAIIAIVFFVAGLRISPTATLNGLRDWRLHGTTLGLTFVAFPVVAGLVALATAPLVGTELTTGLLFLGALPSVVQTSVTFVSMARGNTAAAVCAASISNLAGVVVTPLLVLLLIGSYAGIGLGQVVAVLTQILVPFAIGQALHGRLGGWAARHAVAVRWVDRGAVLLIVYSAFGAAVAGGVWQRLPVSQLVVVGVCCATLLAVALTVSYFGSGALGFAREERAVITFCGSEKSLTTGLPMSTILFSASLAGVVIVPVIIYHQLQLIACSLIARKLGDRVESPVIA
ncbi:bile acid:sodium symporter family protein [Nocardia camponoti]|uniref:bile acid:sodium symporter family protein n=1 Tax=Nocardia camponoti TaxID=1616106 RepID=UPI00166CDF45|nr:bile acid:sodium symporter family protein [Nocardia camponoti]